MWRVPVEFMFPKNEPFGIISIVPCYLSVQ